MDLGRGRVLGRALHLSARVVRGLVRRGGGGVARTQQGPQAPRGTLPDIIHHHVPQGYPRAAMDLTPSPPDSRDEAIAARVIAAFVRATEVERASIPTEEQPTEGIWEMNKHAFHGPMYALLDRRDAAGLASYLRNGFRTTAAHGIGPGAQVFEAAASPESAYAISTIIVDRIVALAEALAVLPYENPEQGRWGSNIYADFGEVVAGIERIVGHRLGFPQVFGNFGVRAGDRVIDVRTPDNVYTVHRMSTLLDGLAGRSILEIGAGFGGTAYYSVLRGVASFTTVDLPFMNALQGFFLIKALGDEYVRLFGEENASPGVHVLPYWAIRNFRDRQFDITMNQDSLPELPLSRAREYLETIPTYTTSFFYSINQESMGCTDRLDGQQLVVPRLVEGNPAYRRIARNSYWLRRGYVEEVYELGPDRKP